MDWGWVLFGAYAVILCAMVCIVRIGGPMRRTIWTLFAVMVTGTGLQLAFGNPWFYSAFMILVNAVGCRIAVKKPAGQWQSLVGWLFILQIGADSGRVVREINGQLSDMTFLYWVTTAIAFAQLLLVIGWGIHARLRRDHRDRSADPVADPSRRPGMA